MSQYELKKLDPEVKLEVQWHGEDTLVQVERNAEKVAVKKGDVIKVSLDLAKTLLQYSGNWTLKGDEPRAHGWDKAQAAAFARLEKEAKDAASKGKKGAKAGAGAKEEAPAFLSPEEVKKMNTKAVVAKLKEMGVDHAADAKLADLKDVLLNAIEAAKGEAAKAGAGATTENDGEGDEEDEAGE